MKVVGIAAPLPSAGLRALLDALGEQAGVRFVERLFGHDAGLDAWVLPAAGADDLQRSFRCGLPCYVVVRDDLRVSCGTSSTLRFGLHAALSPALAARLLATDEAGPAKALPLLPGETTVLVSKAEAPLWAVQETGGRQRHYVSVSLPELREGEALFHYFQGERFLQALPLLLFLRALTEEPAWEPPPLQACFMFDDPNLHWRTYGFIDFAEIAAHAHRHEYHVAFATIPLDAWFFHGPTARLFRRHPELLSLLIHGNDHIAREWARPYRQGGLAKSLEQALSRIAAFEQRSGIEVARVMAPPHGACSEGALGEMARLGFEAACVSSGSLRFYNEKADWLRALGAGPSHLIRGVPVFTRFRLSGACRNSIVLAAVLRQPIIPVGHHQDAAEGLGLLDELSGFIRSLGPVQWAGMKRIARSHYARRIDGDLLTVRMLTRRSELTVPEGITRVAIERPRLEGRGSPLFAWRPLDKFATWRPHQPDEPVFVRPRQKIEIIAGAPMPSSARPHPNGAASLWPVVRRQLTELRDRSAPLLRSLALPGGIDE